MKSTEGNVSTKVSTNGKVWVLNEYYLEDDVGDMGYSTVWVGRSSKEAKERALRRAQNYCDCLYGIGGNVRHSSQYFEGLVWKEFYDLAIFITDGYEETSLSIEGGTYKWTIQCMDLVTK